MARRKKSNLSALEIYTIDTVTMKKSWFEVIPVESVEEANQILRTNPEFHNNAKLMCSMSTPRGGGRMPFYFTSWCYFYAPGSLFGVLPINEISPGTRFTIPNYPKEEDGTEAIFLAVVDVSGRRGFVYLSDDLKGMATFYETSSPFWGDPKWQAVRING